MKRSYVCVVYSTILFLAGMAHSGTTKDDSKLSNPYVLTYPFNSAIIYYEGKIEYGHGEGKYRNKSAKGIEVVYIKEDKLAKVTKMTTPAPDGKTKDVETLQIFTPEYVYMIDLVNKTGIKMDNSKKYGKVEYEKLSPEEKKAFHTRMEKRGVVSLDLLGLGRKVGKEKILGQVCNIYESGEKLTQEDLLTEIQSGQSPVYMKSWIWEEAKIPLKVITERIGTTSELVATKLEKDVEIPDSQFIVPADVRVTHDEEKSEAAKQQTMARFQLYKTGLPMVRRYKVDKEIIDSKVASQSNEKNQMTRMEDKKNEADNSANSYTDRILNYLSDVLKR